MKNLKAMRARWEGITSELVDPKTIRTSEGLQYRDPRHLVFAQQHHAEKESLHHIADMAEALRRDPNAELEPALVGRIDGELWMVDGHHRLDAYLSVSPPRRMPVRIMDTTANKAAAMAMRANLEHAKLRMASGQKLECLWQYLGLVTLRGRKELKEVMTVDAVQEEIPGSSRGSIGRMSKHLFELDVRKFDREDINPQTRWPTWKAVCRSLRPEGDDETAEDHPLESLSRTAQKFARAILDMHERDATALGEALEAIMDNQKAEQLGVRGEELQEEAERLKLALAAVEKYEF